MGKDTKKVDYRFEEKDLSKTIGFQPGSTALQSGDLPFIPATEFVQRQALEAGQHRRAAMLRMNGLGAENRE